MHGISWLIKSTFIGQRHIHTSDGSSIGFECEDLDDKTIQERKIYVINDKSGLSA